jgi:mono/diheme cytochrome c family protein
MIGLVRRSTVAVRLIALMTSALMLAACGGSPANSPSGDNAARPTIIPTFAFVPPTVAPQIATAAATRSADAIAEATAAVMSMDDLQRIERGRERYETLSCWACHGENAEGGSAMPLNDLTMSESEFITIMRSAITLEDGTIHQFATNLLSQSGGRNLYAYLQSLRAS